jgi:hypothetical protein
MNCEKGRHEPKLTDDCSHRVGQSVGLIPRLSFFTKQMSETLLLANAHNNADVFLHVLVHLSLRDVASLVCTCQGFGAFLTTHSRSALFHARVKIDALYSMTRCAWACHSVAHVHVTSLLTGSHIAILTRFSRLRSVRLCVWADRVSRDHWTRACVALPSLCVLEVAFAPEHTCLSAHTLLQSVASLPKLTRLRLRRVWCRIDSLPLETLGLTLRHLTIETEVEGGDTPTPLQVYLLSHLQSSLLRVVVTCRACALPTVKPHCCRECGALFCDHAPCSRFFSKSFALCSICYRPQVQTSCDGCGNTYDQIMCRAYPEPCNTCHVAPCALDVHADAPLVGSRIRIIRPYNTARGQEVDVLQVEGRDAHLLFGASNPSGSGCTIWKNLDRADWELVTPPTHEPLDPPCAKCVDRTPLACKQCM